MKKYLALFIAVILAFSVILTACDTQTSQSSSSEESSVPESSASEPESSASEPESSASEPESSASEPESAASEPEESSTPEESEPGLESIDIISGYARIREIGNDYLIMRYHYDGETIYFITYFDIGDRDVIVSDEVIILGTLEPLEEPFTFEDSVDQTQTVTYSLDPSGIKEFEFEFDNFAPKSFSVYAVTKDYSILKSGTRYFKYSGDNFKDYPIGIYMRPVFEDYLNVTKIETPIEFGVLSGDVIAITKSTSDNPNAYEITSIGAYACSVIIDGISVEVTQPGSVFDDYFKDHGINVGDFVELTIEGEWTIHKYFAAYDLGSDTITFTNATYGAAKPIIYLYPEEEMEVEVSLDLIGEFTCVYPEYNDSWKVTAQPDGTLTDALDREYYCLYWEAEFYRPLVDDTNIGFMVKGEDTAEFLREKLLQIGLSEREANEFIIYWLPQMQHNNYNYIYFSFDEYEEVAKLNVSGKPDTVIRFMMVWEGLEEARPVIEQELPETPERKGFTVVEWGGSEIK